MRRGLCLARRTAVRSLSTGAGAKPPPAPGPSFPPGTSAAAQAPKQALPAAPASIAPAREGPAVAGTPQSAPQLPQPPQKAGGSVGNGLAFAAVVAAVAGAGYVAVEHFGAAQSPLPKQQQAASVQSLVKDEEQAKLPASLDVEKPARGVATAASDASSEVGSMEPEAVVPPPKTAEELEQEAADETTMTVALAQALADEAREAEIALAAFHAAEREREAAEAEAAALAAEVAEAAAVSEAAGAIAAGDAGAQAAHPGFVPAPRPWRLPGVHLPSAGSAPEAPGSPALVGRTLEEGAAAGQAWADLYKAMLRQAEVDHAAFEEVLARREAVFVEEISAIRQAALEGASAARSAAAAATQRVADLTAALDAAALAHAAQRQRFRETHTERCQQALQLQRERWAEEQAAMIEQERASAAGPGAELAARVEAVSSALHSATKAHRMAADAHALAAAACALEAAVESSAPFAPQLQAVVAACSGDEVVAAAAAAVSGSAARGVPTPSQLASLLAGDVGHEVRAAALMPPSGGALSLALSRMAAALRVKEAPRNATPGRGGVEGALAAAAQALADSHPAAAAAALEEATRGSAAASVAASWVAAARARAEAEQLVRLVKAQGLLLSISIGGDSGGGVQEQRRDEDD